MNKRAVYPPGHWSDSCIFCVPELIVGQRALLKGLLPGRSAGPLAAPFLARL